MSVENRTNWLLEIVWFTSKGINLALWISFALIIGYYATLAVGKCFFQKKIEGKAQ